MSTPSKPRFHHGDLHRALLQAARQLLERDGVSALSLRQLAQATGVSHAAPYHHFADKSALLAALVEECFAELAECTQAAAERSGSDPFDRLTGLGEGYVAFALANPGCFRLMFRPELAGEPTLLEPRQSARGGAFEQLVLVIADCLRGSPLAVTADSYVLNAWSAVHGAASLWLDGSLANRCGEMGLDQQALAQNVVRTWVAMFRAQVSAIDVSAT